MTAINLSNTLQAGANGSSAILAWRSDTLGNSTSAVYLHSFYGSAPADASEQVSRVVVRSAGTIRNLRASRDLAAISSALTIRINGVDSGVTATIASGGTSASDTTHAASVVANDIVSLKVVSNVASTSNVAPSAFAEFAT
jgi:hypothetical protein